MLHGWVALTATVIGVLPTVGIIIWAAITPSLWLLIVMPIVGVLNGVLAAWLLGKVAINYLNSRMVDVFSRIRYARVFRDGAPKLLDGIADATLKGELQAAAEKQKERDKKLAKAEKN